MVLEPDPPCASERLLGLAEMEKSLSTGAVTVMITSTEWLAEAPVAVTVTV